jgi:hypothetical protein
MQHIERSAPQHVGRQERAQRTGARPRERKTRRAAQRREQQALDSSLPEKMKTCRAQRNTNGKFLRSRSGARQHQICDVHDRDQKHQRRRPEQGVQPRPVVARQIVPQRQNRDRMSGPHVFIDLPRNPGKIAPGAFDRNSRLQSGEHGQIVGAMLGKGRSAFERNPNIGRMDRTHPRRRDSNYSRRDSAQSDGLADHVLRSSELALPESISEDHRKLARQCVISRSEATAHDGSPTEHRKISVAHQRAPYSRRLLLSGQTLPRHVVRDHR